MPLHTDIDDYVLGEAADDEGQYMYLLDPVRCEFCAAARYIDARGYYELINLVADGYGPTMFLLLMQKARREGRAGVAPDLKLSTDEAKRMNARFYAEPPAGVTCVPNADAALPEVYLDQIYSIAAEIVPERRARRNAERHFGRTAGSRAALLRLRERDPGTHDLWHTNAGILGLVRQYLIRSELPYKNSA